MRHVPQETIDALEKVRQACRRAGVLYIAACESRSQAEDLRAELAQSRNSFAPGASALTAAELRLLPMLLTHLSFPQIAGEMFLSPNTVKSQAMSIYHKLGTSSRSEAVTRSRELGHERDADDR